ncbi:hypothetical protein [Desulfovibrio sp. SGI.169]|uniref:hypothetical protein n=1 Tax=Desulfovibrio sp. SGI.169 TaxID=3420561 RepID=UPI003D088B21
MCEDASLLAGGALPPASLVCLRRGEWARDDARAVLRPLEGELLKIAGTGEAAHPWRCLYYRNGGEGASCGIYDRRPAQCRALFCADTAPLEAMLAHGGMLDRRAALETLADQALHPVAPALCLELINAHDEACPAGRALALAAALGFRPRGALTGGGPLSVGGGEAARAELAGMVRYDAAFRELCVTRGGAPASWLPFLLGRPLTVLLAEVGLRAAAG